ncbi:hypothetical protein PCASD_25208 [Puccinia coronata f. sp. avenae]|uniref:Threonine/serine exporter-like N-terminal domain-containing protein n=1 Tax=Puccinia coronata f. sp. avenae TaxID=200324 RepID=A0A2N5RW16_9BASI|nr:hypothetical protein PCASD_25208 [Puccinia coronata f. sp. avenae]
MSANAPKSLVFVRRESSRGRSTSAPSSNHFAIPDIGPSSTSKAIHPHQPCPGPHSLFGVNEDAFQTDHSPCPSSLHESQPPSYPERSHDSHHYCNPEDIRHESHLTSSLAAPPIPISNGMHNSGERLIALHLQDQLEGRRNDTGTNQHLESGYPRLPGHEGGDGPGPGGRGDRRHGTSQPANKPGLHRATTEEVVEREPNRKAADIVGSHIKRRHGKTSEKDKSPPSDHEESDDEFHIVNPPAPSAPKGGVLSHLLELYGHHHARPVERSGSASSATTTLLYEDEKSVALSRHISTDQPGSARMIQRHIPLSFSPWDPAHEKLDHSQPPLKSERHQLKHQLSALAKRNKLKRAHDSDGAWSDATNARSESSVKTFRQVVAGAVQGQIQNRSWMRNRARRARITRHIADILKRQNFILMLAQALMATGAPSHHLESQLSATARVLEIDAQFVHLPSILIATFSDADTRTCETHFVRASGEIDLGQLHRVHHVYKSVVHDHTGVTEGSVALHRILNEGPLYNPWQRVLIAFFCCGTICMLEFDGSFVDGWVAGVFGSFLAIVKLKTSSNQIYSSIFEISLASIISFISRGLSTTRIFCYKSLSSAGVALILPGYEILCSSLDLASRNLIAGSVNMIYAVIYCLFLGFGFAIGSDVYYLLDPKSQQHLAGMQSAAPGYKMWGSFQGMNGTAPGINGLFTLKNDDGSLNGEGPFQQEAVQCYRDPNGQWWRQSANPYWFFLLVPMFSFFQSLWNLQPIWTKQMPVMVVIACVGWFCNFVANQFIFHQSYVVSFLGAFVIGLLGNMYSRIFKGTAFTSMVTGVLFLVPSGIEAAGGLAMTHHSNSGNSYGTNALAIGFRTAQVASGITVGLFFSSFFVYAFGHGKSSAAFTF